MKNKIVFTNVIYIILYLISLLPFINGEKINSFILLIISGGLLIIIIFFIMKRIKYLVPLGYLIFNWIILIIGSLLLDLGVNPFLSKGIILSMNTGASIRVVLIFIIFINFYYYFVKQDINKNIVVSKEGKASVRLLVIFFIIISQLIIFRVINTNGVNFVDRMSYYRKHFGILETISLSILMKSSFFLGLFYIKTKNKKYIIINIISILLLKLTGSKFGEIFINIMYFLYPIFLIFGLNQNYKSGYLEKENKVGKTKYIILAMVVSILLFFSVYSAYKKALGPNSTAKQSIELIVNRLASQSVLYNNIEKENSNYIEFFDEVTVIKYIRFNIIDYIKIKKQQLGLYRLNYIFSKQLYEENISKGYNLSGGFPGILIYYFGFFLTIPIIIMFAKVLSLVYKVSIKFALDNDILGILLVIDIFNYFNSILILGNLYYLFRPTFIIKVIFITVYFNFRRGIKNV